MAIYSNFTHTVDLYNVDYKKREELNVLNKFTYHIYTYVLHIQSISHTVQFEYRTYIPLWVNDPLINDTSTLCWNFDLSCHPEAGHPDQEYWITVNTHPLVNR